MATDLTDDTVDTTRATRRTSTAGQCVHCRRGNHTLCTGVSCLPLCTHPVHSHKPGVPGLSDGLEGGKA